MTRLIDLPVALVSIVLDTAEYWPAPTDWRGQGSSLTAWPVAALTDIAGDLIAEIERHRIP